jgi:hypothetical protein
MGYFTALSASKTYILRERWIMNCKRLGRKWSFHSTSAIRTFPLEGLSEATRNFSQDNRCTCRDSNQTLLEYESRALAQWQSTRRNKTLKNKCLQTDRRFDCYPFTYKRIVPYFPEVLNIIVFSSVKAQFTNIINWSTFSLKRKFILHYLLQNTAYSAIYYHLSVSFTRNEDCM